MDNLQYIIEHVPAAARIEQLAEEAAELAQAALKMARVMRDENPTPVPYMEALRRLREEYTDVFVAAIAAELLVDSELGKAKMERWAGRVKERLEPHDEKQG